MHWPWVTQRLCWRKSRRFTSSETQSSLLCVGLIFWNCIIVQWSWKLPKDFLNSKMFKFRKEQQDALVNLMWIHFVTFIPLCFTSTVFWFWTERCVSQLRMRVCELIMQGCFTKSSLKLHISAIWWQVKIPGSGSGQQRWLRHSPKQNLHTRILWHSSPLNVFGWWSSGLMIALIKSNKRFSNYIKEGNGCPLFPN